MRLQLFVVLVGEFIEHIKTHLILLVWVSLQWCRSNNVNFLSFLSPVLATLIRFLLNSLLISRCISIYWVCDWGDCPIVEGRALSSKEAPKLYFFVHDLCFSSLSVAISTLIRIVTEPSLSRRHVVTESLLAISCGWILSTYAIDRAIRTPWWFLAVAYYKKLKLFFSIGIISRKKYCI